MSVSPPARVLNLLKMGHPLREVERWTGWPVHSVRRLVARQGWLVDHRGRAYDPNEVRLPNHPRLTAEEARDLYARLKARREQLGWTWARVAIALGTHEPALRRLAGGSGTTHTRDRAEAWLAQTNRIPHVERQSA